MDPKEGITECITKHNAMHLNVAEMFHQDQRSEDHQGLKNSFSTKVNIHAKFRSTSSNIYVIFY